MTEINFHSLKTYSLEDTNLRDYQQENKQKVYDVWGQGKSVMLQMPTGTGKTRLFVSIIKDIFRYSRDNKDALKVLILVHRTELIDQIDEELGYRYNLAHGIIQSGERERKIYPIQLASVQTLSRRLGNWTEKEFDFIIVDEAHHIKADSYQKIINAFPHAKLLGVTATPVRLNGQGFTDTFDELIVSPSVKHFIDEGYLSQYEYYSVSRSSFIQQQIDGIKKFSQGDYAESELERICDNDRIRAQVVKTYLEYAKDKKGIVYTINKEHNKNLCAEFIENGVKAVAIDSDTPQETREKYIEQFRRGDFQIICNVNLFTEGFDCPDIEFVQLARPTKSLALYLQQVGRGLRISETKEKTLFLDNVGLYNRFGFPSSRRMWRHHFEGKFIGNKTEKEVEEPKKAQNTDAVKRKRHQDLEEGHEKIHLIQTTEEKEWLQQRKAQFQNWTHSYVDSYVNCVIKAFEDVCRPGLELVEVKGFSEGNFIPHFRTKVKEFTSDVVCEYEEEYFEFTVDDKGKSHKEHRKCKNYDEYETQKTTSFYIQLFYYLKQEFKHLSLDYKALHFTYSELVEFLPDMYSLTNDIPVSREDFCISSLSTKFVVYHSVVISIIFGGKRYQVFNIWGEVINEINKLIKTLNGENVDNE